MPLFQICIELGQKSSSNFKYAELELQTSNKCEP
jgi:hypothetical protein